VFLTAAANVKEPPWAPAALLIASICFVPMFLGFVFLLQTKFRQEIQEDKYYAEQIKLNLSKQSQTIHDLLIGADLGFEGLIQGRTVHDVDIEKREEIQSTIQRFEDPLLHLEGGGSLLEETDPKILSEYGKALLANREWKRATKYLDVYAIKKPADWNGHFLRGIAHANSEEGREADIATLTAYSNALLVAPSDMEENRLARFLSYRAAMLKRLRRFDEAIKDLTRAQDIASNYYEIHDIKYNLACIYAMQGDRDSLLNMLQQLKSAQHELARIRKHKDDYFVKFKDDAEFLEAIMEKTLQS
jgi:Flp pilus assembly protein TadD